MASGEPHLRARGFRGRAALCQPKPALSCDWPLTDDKTRVGCGNCKRILGLSEEPECQN